MKMLHVHGFIAAALLAVALPSSAQLRISLESASRAYTWGGPTQIRATIDGECGYEGYVGKPSIELYSTSVGTVGSGALTPFPVTCSSTAFSTSAPIAPNWGILRFGEYVVSASFPLGSHFMYSAPISIRFDPEFDLPSPKGRVQAGIAPFPSRAGCAMRDVRIVDRETAAFPMPPANVRTPYGLVVFSGSQCPQNDGQSVMLQLPETVGEVWIYSGSKWQRGDVECGFGVCPWWVIWRLGNAVTTGFWAGSDRTFQAALAIGYPQADARPMDLQDMWWAGPSESGWGLTIAKNNERMFVAGFVYDAAGKPTWIVMPNGQWDASSNVYYGDLYMPKGTPYSAYSATGFDMRAAAGKGSLSFTSAQEGYFDYTLGTRAGGKSIARFEFAQRGGAAAPYAGIWWGGAGQDGWGLSVAQQGETIFATWYTYGADGEPAWFYMPAGAKIGAGTYAGKLYKTTGAPWPGSHYDASQTRAIEVGTLELQFSEKSRMTAVIDGRTVANPIERFAF